MKKTLMASKKVMQNYLSELLTEPDIHASNNIAKYSPEAPIKKVTPDNKTTVVRDKRSLETLLKTVNQPRTVKLVDEVNPNDTSKVSPTSLLSQKNRLTVLLNRLRVIARVTF
jgi:purine-binding chemotaxis protein CheW